MKQTILTILVLVSIGVSAQKIGVIGGFNYCFTERVTMLPGSSLNNKIETKGIYGLRTGIVLEYEYPAGMTLGVQGLYSQKGYTYNTLDGEEVEESINYLDIPVYLGYTYTISEKAQVIYNYFPIKIFFVVGLEFGNALNGNNISPLRETEIQFGDEVPEFRSNEIIYQKLNMQGILTGGLIVGSLRLSVGYDIGLKNLENNEERTLKFNTLHASLGFVFDFKQKRW